jgi:hypothetical protein
MEYQTSREDRDITEIPDLETRRLDDANVFHFGSLPEELSFSTATLLVG